MSEKKDEMQRDGISRRGFLRGVSAGSVASGVVVGVTQELAAANEALRLQGPGEIQITLNVNGKSKPLGVEPRTTLLDALRDRLDLTGSKKVCDRGTCGACTVLVDGKAAYACSMLAVEAEGLAITTVEGLGAPDKLSVLQAAFVDHDGQQCGFCTPGMVVACTVFLEENPDPTLDEVREGIGGNLCRCGTYTGVIAAVLDTAKAMKGGA